MTQEWVLGIEDLGLGNGELGMGNEELNQILSV